MSTRTPSVRGVLLAFCGLLLACPAATVAAPSTATDRASLREMPLRQSLGGTWRAMPGRLRPAGFYAREVDDQDWLEVEVPSNWYTEGHDLAGAVWFRRAFEVPTEVRGRMATLVFEGVDYAADVWINGHYLGFHEGYFAPFSFDVSSHLELGETNVLTVRVDSPLERPGPSWSLNKRLVKGIFGHHDARPGGAWSARGQEQNTGGIWAPVYLEFTDRVRIAGLALDARPGQVATDPDPKAVLSARISLATRVEKPTSVDVQLQVVPEGFLPTHSPFPRREVRHQLRPGTQELGIEMPCPGAHLWWPWDRGEPRLYRLHVTVLAEGDVMDRASEVIGFRRVDFDATTGVLRINGERHFMRGTNYIATQWLSGMSRERYGDDLALMRRAHINAIRIHAHVGARALYQEADRRGLLIWQDFPLQWGYEETPELHNAVMTQAEEMVRHLYNHPSIVIWSGHNEPPWDSDWMRYKYADYRPGQNKDLDDDLAQVLRRADPTRPVHAVSSNAEHPWLGWYSGVWTDYAEPAKVPLITEFGAQALPHLETLRSFIPASALWPDNDKEWAHWNYHNFQQKETFEIAGVEMGSEVQQWIGNTQQYQSDLVQLAAESYRRQRFDPVGGAFQFMFVECWPAIRWALVDHTRRPKPGYYALQTAFQPVLPSIEWQRRTWPAGEREEMSLWVVNDLRESFSDGLLTYTILENDQVLFEKEIRLDIPADSARRIAAVKSLPTKEGSYDLTVRLEAKGLPATATNHLAFEVVAKEGDDAS